MGKEEEMVTVTLKLPAGTLEWLKARTGIGMNATAVTAFVRIERERIEREAERAEIRADG